jgi:molecular chaperone GrpE
MIKETNSPGGDDNIKEHEDLNPAGEPFTPEVSPDELKGDADHANESDEKLRADLEKSQKEYLYLFSEFENYKKRTLRERMLLLSTASQDVIVSLLPVLDDFERAISALEESGTDKKVMEGVELIYHKTKSILEQQGLKKMTSIGEEFNTDFHEAITQIPAEKKSQVNTVLDEVECGYLLNDKVIRHAKVVVAG